MSEKLSTPKLKSLIETWLSNPEMRSKLEHHTTPYHAEERVTQEWIDERAAWYGAKKGLTSAQLEQHVWDIWRDGNKWKREEKRKLKDEWDSYLACGESIWTGYGKDATCTSTPGFAIDLFGEENEELVKKFFNDPKEAAKCIFRMFVPNNGLADNYRLEVVTTPDDSEVVGWTVIVD
jgi:hypothetical protein